MVKTKSFLTRSTAVVSAVALTVAALAPVLMLGRADAGIPTDRQITISDSSASATGVTYDVSFVTDQGGAAADIGGVVVNFCDSPIIGDACGTPTGFTAAAATLDAQTGITGFTKDVINSTATEFILTNGTPDNTASGATVTLTLGGVSNPTLGNYTYYARILTFDTAANAQAYDPTALNPTGFIDAGGLALSTANQLVITSKVQERLVFCVYTATAVTDPTITSCTDVDDNASPAHSTITLGDDHGVLDPDGEFVDKTARMRISTNATTGAAIVMKGDTLMSGITNDIAEIGAGPSLSIPTSEQFGMCMYESGTSGFTISNASYNHADCATQTVQTAGTAVSDPTPGTAQYGFNTTNTTSATGDTLGTKAAGLQSKVVLAFVGNIDYVTEAGIYQTTLTFIATGTY